MNKQTPSGICQICGCTQSDCTQCIERYGSPCSWTTSEENMCSACQYYLDSLEIFEEISIKLSTLLKDLIKGTKVSKLEYDHKLSLWRVYYSWDPHGNSTDTFVSAEDLLLFLTADHSGN